MSQKEKGILIIIIVVLVSIYFINKKEAIAPVVSAPQEVCYFRETVGAEGTDDAFTSINYDEGGKVHGIINWIPSEKDTLVGTYAGTVEQSEVAGYPTRLHIVYAANGEGIVSNQEEIILVGANDIKTGTGEMAKDEGGVWRIKDMTKLVYDAAVPKVDCASVPVKFKTDYSKVE